jgi:hypothetical protein
MNCISTTIRESTLLTCIRRESDKETGLDRPRLALLQIPTNAHCDGIVDPAPDHEIPVAMPTFRYYSSTR